MPCLGRGGRAPHRVAVIVARALVVPVRGLLALGRAVLRHLARGAAQQWRRLATRGRRARVARAAVVAVAGAAKDALPQRAVGVLENVSPEDFANIPLHTL